ncbi:MAG TPA: hypothetical protein VEM95_03350, partial [Thermoplasmata archaeon]|nr:hypothetical protein [Thermoplasmata archaeon]
AKLGDAIARVRSLGEAKGVRAGFFANVMESGLAYLSPYFEAAKEPPRIYDLSRGVSDIVRSLGDAVFDSRLAHLWNVDPQFVRRAGLVRRMEAGLDTPNAIEPPAALTEEPIDLFPQGAV